MFLCLLGNYFPNIVKSPNWNVNNDPIIFVLADIDIVKSPNWNVNYPDKNKEEFMCIYSKITKLECKY